MPASNPKCIVILSTKSSGSSACQNYLTRFHEINHIRVTRHFQNETLYWTKAASVLGLPQEKMLDSEVPLDKDQAKADLIEILSDNLADYIPPQDETELIFEGWRLLCQKFSPVFIEKSPHHLFQWSALELLAECQNRFSEIETLFVGLIRNPMDALFSAFKRWKTPPEKLQYEWYRSYKNLLNFEKRIGNKFLILKYEDMVSDTGSLKPVLAFAKINGGFSQNNFFHRQSISKWKADQRYGFVLSDKVMDLAEKYGYQKKEMMNTKTALWPCYRYLSRLMYKVKSPLENKIKEIIR